ncbi:restriction endonuclease subunit S [Streptomyces sparsogenes]|uniref:restriction endonuclease subunit S n=1 Tax=Streptomyces sparsogenes TaxID=67365 RepID=UPI0033D94132
MTFLRSQNIHFDGLRLDDVVYISEATHRDMRGTRVKPGDVLLNITGASLGRVSRAPEDLGEANVNQHVCIIRPTTEANDKYLTYALSSHPIQEQISELQVGGNREGLNFEQVGNLIVPAAPAEEQRRIADFLDAETARLGNLVSLRSRQRALIAERAVAAVSEVLIPGILKSPAGVGPYPWLPPLEGIPLVKIGHVSRLRPGISPSTLPRGGDDDVQRPFLQISNVQAGRLRLNSVSEVTIARSTVKRTSLHFGDVLTTRVGDPDKLGRAAVWVNQIKDCLFESNIFALRPDGEKIDPRYLAMMTRTVHGRCYFESTGFKTTGLASTNTGKVLGFPVPLPDVQRQRDLVRQVEKVDFALDSLTTLIDRQLILIAERRQALITAAVTGQFDVSTASGRNVTDGVTA